MKTLRLGAIVVLAISTAFGQQQATPNVGFQIPAYGSQNWSLPLNYNFTTLDQMLSGNRGIPSLNLTTGLQLNGSYGAANSVLTSSGTGTVFSTITALIQAYPGCSTIGYVFTVNSSGTGFICSAAGAGGLVDPGANGLVFRDAFNNTRVATSADIPQIAYSSLSGLPTLATVATSGAYNDLTGKPTIPAAQVQTDWNASSGIGVLLHKPTNVSTFTNDAGYLTSVSWSIVSGKPTFATVATSGSYADLTNKPTLAATIAAASHNFLTSYTSTTGAFTQAQPAFSDISGTLTSGQIPATIAANTTGTAANVTGTVALGNGGTGQTSAAAGFNALSPMSAVGDLIYGGTSGAGTRLAGNTATTKKFLTSAGTGAAATAPAWGTLAASDVPAISALSGSLNIAQINATGTASSTTFLRGDGTWNAPTPGFASVGSGTSTAALVIGSGGSLSATGTGSIGATTVPASGITGTPITGGEAAIATGPASSIANNLATFANTTGGLQDSGIAVSSLAPKASPTLTGTTTVTNLTVTGTCTGCSAGSTAFGSLSSGTNTAMAGIIGTGASLATSGSGTIAATSVPAAGITGTALPSGITGSSLTSAAGGAFGTAAYASTGTSGATVPLLNGANTHSGLNTYAAGINLSGTTSPLQVAGSAGSAGYPLLSGGGGATPSYGQIDLGSAVTGNLSVAHLNSGASASSSTFWRGDGTWATPAGGGTVTSVATSGPITGGPITGTGTLSCPTCVTASAPGSGVAHFAGATQSVTSGPVSLSGDVSGNLPVTNLNSGTGASSSSYWRGDGTWATPSFVSSVGLSVPSGSIFSVSGSPITLSGTIGISTFGTSGGIPYFSSSTQLSSSGVLTAHGLVVGEGGGTAPTALTPVADSLPLWQTSTSDPTVTAVNNCATALTYSTSTHTFGCNSSITSAFSSITAGTNTSALVVGTGGSLGVSGSGTINATSVNGNSFPAGAGLTSGGVLYASGASAVVSSGALTHYGVVYGGGAGQAPVATAADTTSTHALFATATAPAFRAITAADVSTAVNLAASGAGGVTGNLPVANLNSGTGASSSTFWRGDGTWATPSAGGVSLTPSSTQTIIGSGTTTVPLVIQAPASTSVNMLTVEDSSSNVNLGVDSAGDVLVNGNGSSYIQPAAGYTHLAMRSPGANIDLYAGGNSSDTGLATNTYNEYTGGSAGASGDVMGFSAANTIADCPTSCTNPIGIDSSFTTGFASRVQTSGIAGVNFDGSYSPAYGWFACVSPTTAGKVIPQSTACTSTWQVGVFKQTYTGATAGNIQIVLAPPTGSGGSSIANIQVTLPTTAISANSCTTPATATMTGVTTTSAFITAFATNPNAVTGWGSSGGLTFTAWPTANTLNWSVCNATSSSITPGAMTLNVGAR